VDGFFVLAAGFAGVDVDVEEGGEEDVSGAVDDGGVGHGSDGIGNASDAVTFDEDIGAAGFAVVFGGDEGGAVEAFHEWGRWWAVWEGKSRGCDSGVFKNSKCPCGGGGG
jgi:hypothetical protein